MVCWCFNQGVPFDVAHAMTDFELLAYAIVLTGFQNPKIEWDWTRMQFFERK